MYLDGKTNTSSLPDPLHNIKASRGQCIGGSSAAAIGMSLFDPWMLKVAGIARELIRIDDHSSDALPMRLASAENISKLIGCNFWDVGNCAVTVVSLAMLRIHSYAVNGNDIPF